jgi:hypothetical protein
VAYNRAPELLKAIGDADPTLIMIPAASVGSTPPLPRSAAELIMLSRDAEALPAPERTQQAREVLIRANPSMARNRAQLTWVLRPIGGIRLRAGRMSEARASLARAQEIAQRLADEHPGDHGIRLDLAAVYADLGDLLVAVGRPVEAPAWFDKARAVVRKIIEASPSASRCRASQADMLRRPGAALPKCGRPAEAAAPRESIAILRGLSHPMSEAPTTSPGPSPRCGASGPRPARF